MGNKTFLYIGAGILLLIGICLLGYGILNIVGSTASQANASWFGFGIGFAFIGAIFLGGGILLVVRGQAKGPTGGGGDNITYKIDLPSQTKVEQLKCNSCGGSLKADNVKMIAGAPTVECPFCGTTYQLTEEPKW